MDRQPDASLLLPCTRPVAPPPNATNKDVALGWIDAVVKYLSCEAKHQALVNFVKAGPSAAK